MGADNLKASEGAWESSDIRKPGTWGARAGHEEQGKADALWRSRSRQPWIWSEELPGCAYVW